jgi:tetratricopeptide (TPR) repeat protein
MVVAAMLGGVMAKPTIVTLPFVLLILDWWPLRRSDPWRRLVIEKVPLFALSAASSLVTYIGQEQMGATRLMGELSFTVRLSNAVVSYAWYVRTFVWPQDLSVLYPYRKDLDSAAAFGALVFLSAIGAFAVWRTRRQPYILAGWLWFLGTLVPAIGLIQVGSQAQADRFTYIPLVGLFIAFVWGGSELLSSWRAGARVVVGLFLAVSMAAASRIQTAYWQDSITLFKRAIEVTDNDAVAQHNLGYALAEKHLYTEALPHYQNALRMNPKHAEGYYNLGRAQWSLGRSREAMDSFREAIRLKPVYAEAHFALATLALREKDEPTATVHYQEALRLGVAPEYAAEAHNDLGVLAARRGLFGQAESHFRTAITLKPDLVRARQNLANVAAQPGNTVSPP